MQKGGDEKVSPNPRSHGIKHNEVLERTFKVCSTLPTLLLPLPLPYLVLTYKVALKTCFSGEKNPRPA